MATHGLTTTTNPTWSGEGVDPNHFLTIRREAKCQELFNLATDAGAVLVRAPPSAGKTALATMFAVWAAAKQFQIIHLTLLDWNRKEQKSISQLLYSRCAIQMNTLFRYSSSPYQSMTAKDEENRNPKIFIIDELQISYNAQEDSFWESMKRNMQVRRGHRSVIVICFAAYGESSGHQTPRNLATPVQFSEVLGLEFLRFDKTEWESICEKWNAKALNPLDANAIELLFRLTSGHCGLLMEALRELGKIFRTQLADDHRSSKIISTVMSASMLNKWKSNRSLIRVISALDDEQQVFVRRVLNEDTSGLLTTNLNRHDSRILVDLVKGGLLCEVKHGGFFGVAAPIVRTILIGVLLAGEMRSTPSSLINFIMELLPLFSKSQLQDLHSGGKDGRPLERSFQMEFFRCAYAALGSQRGICHADVGAVFGSAGALDFYIDTDLQWGIELLRDSDRLQQHQERFTTRTGIYSMIPLKDWVLLNFVERVDLASARSFRNPKFEKEVRIYYARECDFMVVKTFDKSITRLTLLAP